MKTAYLWVFVETLTSKRDYHRVCANLIFSSPEKFKKELEYSIGFKHLIDLPTTEEEILGFCGVCSQLVEIQVPNEFCDWDCIPDNY